MSNDGFKFQYREGDEVEFKGGAWLIECNAEQDRDVVRILYGQHRATVNRINVKPANKTVERYDAEYLAWQQSRIAVGDWVERLVEHVAVAAGNGRGENLMKGAVFKITGEFENSSSMFVSCDTLRHPRADLKPCDPPKPENIKEGQFEIDGDSLIALKYMSCWGSVATHDGKPEVVFNAHGGRPVLHPDDLRSIASLLDRYQASIAPA